MKPSNMFADITEEKFNQLEAAKNLYKMELQQQIELTKAKVMSEKKRKILEDIEEEKRILQELEDINNSNSPQKQDSEPKQKPLKTKRTITPSNDYDN